MLTDFSLGERASEISPTVDQLSRTELEDWVFAQTKGIVQSGPFAGMTMLRETAWPDGCLCPMLLGCHEQELHAVLEREIERLSHLDNPQVVNVGCAEGYYAIGMARRLPRATVWAMDISSNAVNLAARAAGKNDVSLIFSNSLSDACEAPDLVIMDCEGAEQRFVDTTLLPGLKRAHLIVEIHNTLPDKNVAQILLDRCRSEFHIIAMREGPRDPNDFEFLRPFSSLVRWLAVCENRPCMMGWYIMRPKERP